MPRSSDDTEQAKALDDLMQIRAECNAIVVATVDKWREHKELRGFCGERLLLKHKEMFDLMQCTKEGDGKENTFFDWCRKVASLREQMTSAPTDTNWYKVLACPILSVLFIYNVLTEF